MWIRTPARARFGDYATKWLAARRDEATTMARDASVMRKHVLPRWGTTPLGRIDHLGVQTWISGLGSQLAPATVAECNRLLTGVLRAALRDRLIGANPAQGVKVPARRKK